MSKNRLNLNFNLSTREERRNFLETYLSLINFTPNSEELETMSNYLLWGKNNEGKNGRQEGLDLPSRSSDWQPNDRQTESLDALIDAPTFSETEIRPITTVPYKTPKLKLDRAYIRETAPISLLPLFEDLWYKIDQTDFIINQYELLHGKKTEIRPSLRAISTQSLINAAAKLNAYSYLKTRHYLVELRREQYTLKDTYLSPIQPHTISSPVEDQAPELLSEISVLPFGLPTTPLLKKLFNPDHFPFPSEFSETELRELSSTLWTKPHLTQFIIDFRDSAQLYSFSQNYLSLLKDEPKNSETFSLLFTLFQTYADLSPLKPFQRDILRMRLERKSNEEIVSYLQHTYSHKYNTNYISTIFCKSILPAIAETAALHYETIQNLFFPENFKTCIDCGVTLLKSPLNFVRKSKVKDGFSPRCKQCEHERKKS